MPLSVAVATLICDACTGLLVLSVALRSGISVTALVATTVVLSLVPPSEKVTRPRGEPPGSAITVAVKVTDWPKTEGLALDVREIVDLFLKHGADVNAMAVSGVAKGQRVVHYAATTGKLAVVKQLVAQARNEPRNENREAARFDVVVIEGAGMWRWAFLPPQYQKQEEIYGGLWHSMLRWLVSATGLMPV